MMSRCREQSGVSQRGRLGVAGGFGVHARTRCRLPGGVGARLRLLPAGRRLGRRGTRTSRSSLPPAISSKRAACQELGEVAERQASQALGTMADYARGAVHLADGDARTAPSRCGTPARPGRSSEPHARPPARAYWWGGPAPGWAISTGGAPDQGRRRRLRRARPPLADGGQRPAGAPADGEQRRGWRPCTRSRTSGGTVVPPHTSRLGSGWSGSARDQTHGALVHCTRATSCQTGLLRLSLCVPGDLRAGSPSLRDVRRGVHRRRGHGHAATATTEATRRHARSRWCHAAQCPRCRLRREEQHRAAPARRWARCTHASLPPFTANRH